MQPQSNSKICFDVPVNKKNHGQTNAEVEELKKSIESCDSHCTTTSIFIGRRIRLKMLESDDRCELSIGKFQRVSHPYALNGRYVSLTFCYYGQYFWLWMYNSLCITSRFLDYFILFFLMWRLHPTWPIVRSNQILLAISFHFFDFKCLDRNGIFFWFDSKGIPNPYYNLRNIRVWIYQDKIVVMKFTNVRIFAFELARMKPGRSVEMRDTERNHFYILFRHFHWLFDSLLPFRQVRYNIFVIQKFSTVWINAVHPKSSHIAMSDLYNGDFIVFIRFHCIQMWGNLSLLSNSKF